jgi:hypothetical protein
MIKVKNSTEFDNLLRALADDIVLAHIHYQLYKDLRQALSDHPSVVHQSNTFWQLTLNAHINTSSLALSRAYDQEKDSLHLHGWLLTIRKHLHLFDQDAFRQRLKSNPFVESLAQLPRKPDSRVLEEDIQRCSSKDPLVKTLRNLRGKAIAHRSASLTITQKNIYADYPFTFGDYEELLARAIAILNRYCRLFAAVTYSTNMIGLDDYQFIFKSVEEKIQRTEEE